MKIVPLTKGQVAIISDRDWPLIQKYNWWAQQDTLSSGGIRWYARGKVNGRKMFMHRLLLGNPPLGDVDHRDGDGLNNTRRNLRCATRTNNLGNRGKTLANTSGYKGVTWDNNRKKWKMQVKCAGVFVQKRFASKRAAATAYAHYAKLLFGVFARV